MVRRRCAQGGQFEQCWCRAGRRVVESAGVLPTWVLVRGTVWAVLPDWATGPVREMMLCWLMASLVVEGAGEESLVDRMRLHDMRLRRLDDADADAPRLVD